MMHIRRTITFFGHPCPKCGELIMYMEDATYHIANEKIQDNQIKLDKNILKIQEYMKNNELSMNIGKTMLTECMVRQKKG